MKSKDIRQTFINYFAKNGHEPVASSSLIPENDATLLFANAGMNQFKNLFLGLEHRPYTRAVTSQKCVRAGGKHNDLENVGHTARHHTFFEMLGNFSFGDYFKKESIHFGWELLTKELQIPKERLYVTVFETDDEAADIWHKQEGVPRDRIYRFGEKDNFWRMGDVGPCGPCSEIFYDHGPEAEADPAKPSVMGGDGDRYVEIWNHVFMQYNEDATGRHSLPKPSVDTGGGLERWAAVLQGKPNNYDTDLFLPIIQTACQVSKKDYVSDLKVLAKHQDVREVTSALRVIADHSRATAFLIADGVMPSNEGRGYVLRRIMRRAIRYGRKLSDDPSLLMKTVATVVSEMRAFYPELERQVNLIMTTVEDEVTRFLSTLDQGTEILHGHLDKISGRGQKMLNGEMIFKLYDTYGFPVDLTRIMAQEKGFSVDEQGFHDHMEAARSKAKASWKGKAISQDAAHLVAFSQAALDKEGATKFVGYSSLKNSTHIVALSDGHKLVDSLKAGDSGVIAVRETCFYAEGGGQAGDAGHMTIGRHGFAEVLDCTKQNDIYLHHVRITEGNVKPGDSCALEVSESKRRQTASNHSATHLMHAALRKLLGTHVTQAGSLVDAERLRFDYTHNKPLSSDEIEQVEELVNREISLAVQVSATEMEQKKALEAGAMALFGEKYGDRVRVVQMGDFSTELCGGTHVENTAMIRAFKIVSDGGVSAGVRRIEALTGDHAIRYMLKNTRENQFARQVVGLQENWSHYLTIQSSSITDWIESTKTTVKNLEREIKSLKGGAIDLEKILETAQGFSSASGPAKLVCAHIAVDDREALSQVADKLKDRVQKGVILIVGNGDGSFPVVVTVTKDLNPAIAAGKLLGEFAKELGGKGGGRPDFAQGAVPTVQGIDKAFARILAQLK